MARKPGWRSLLSKEDRAADLERARIRYAKAREVKTAKARARWAKYPRWKKQASNFRIHSEHRCFGDMRVELYVLRHFELSHSDHEDWLSSLDSDLGA